MGGVTIRQLSLPADQWCLPTFGKSYPSPNNSLTLRSIDVSTGLQSSNSVSSQMSIAYFLHNMMWRMSRVDWALQLQESMFKPPKRLMQHIMRRPKWLKWCKKICPSIIILNDVNKTPNCVWNLNLSAKKKRR